MLCICSYDLRMISIWLSYDFIMMFLRLSYDAVLFYYDDMMSVIIVFYDFRKTFLWFGYAVIMIFIWFENAFTTCLYIILLWLLVYVSYDFRMIVTTFYNDALRNSIALNIILIRFEYAFAMNLLYCFNIFLIWFE